MEKTGAEQRQHQRAILHSTAFVLLTDKKVAVKTENISVGGLCILTETNLKNNIQFHLLIHLPSKNKIPACSFKALVSVVHSVYSNHDGGFRVGLRFIKIDPHAKSQIQKFVTE